MVASASWGAVATMGALCASIARSARVALASSGPAVARASGASVALAWGCCVVCTLTGKRRHGARVEKWGGPSASHGPMMRRLDVSNRNSVVPVVMVALAWARVLAGPPKRLLARQVTLVSLLHRNT